jgi:DNA ligase-1
VWFAPAAVFEIKAADIQISPKYTCAIGTAHPTKGVGLRFPRFLGVREDKDPEDATPSSMVRGVFDWGRFMICISNRRV